MNNTVDLDIQSLPKIKQKCVQAYNENKEALLFELNHIINENKALKESNKEVAHQIVYDLHRYHVSLLSSVLVLNNYELLAQSLPWEYRAYSNQGLKYEYFLHIYHSWKKCINNVFDEDCSQYFILIYDWLIENHKTIIELSKEIPTNINNPLYEKEIKLFLNKLLEVNHRSILEMSKDFISQQKSITELFTNIMQPALVEIGLLWENGKINSAKEHIATAIITKTLSSLYSNQPYVKTSRGIAVVTAAPNEFHELGALAVAHALEDDGWNVHYLGANTPSRDLISLLRETKADMLAISAIVPFNFKDIGELIDDIKNDSVLKNIKIMFGGRAFDTMPKISKYLGADAHLTNIDEAINKAREWQCNL